MKVSKIKEYIISRRKELRICALFLLLIWFLLNQIETVPSFVSNVMLVLAVAVSLLYLIIDFHEIEGFFRSGTTKKGLRISAALFLIVGVLVMLYYIAAQHTILRIDMTANKRYSLSRQTETLLSRINTKVRFYIFSSQQHMASSFAYAAEFFLKEYQQRNRKISVEMVDMKAEPALVSQYGIKEVGSVLILFGKKRKLLSINDYTRSKLRGRQPYREGRFEEAFTAALSSLARSRQYQVYATMGHGERDFFKSGQMGASQIKNYMENEGFVVKQANLLKSGVVPSDCQLLIVAGAKGAFARKEIQAIEKYLLSGGPAVFMVERDSSLAYKNLLKRWGVVAGKDLVIDPQLMYSAGINIAQYGFHPITKVLAESRRRTVLPLASSLSKTGMVGKKSTPFVYRQLLVSSKNGWAETDPKRAQYNAGEKKGPLAYAYAVTRSARSGKEMHGPEKRMRYVVIGDADFLINIYIDQFTGNRDFFMNTINWAVEQTQNITIRPKVMKQYPLNLTEGEMSFISVFVKIIMPLSVALIGFFVYRRRRKNG